MSNTLTENNAISKLSLKDLFISLLNVGLPLLMVFLLEKYVHTTEITALSIASVVPILSSIAELVRNRRLDLIAIFFLLGLLSSIVAIFLGGSVQLLVIRESLFTGALGLASFVSLLLPRPLMFYVGRQMLCGNDTAKLARFNAGWNDPHTRFVHRLITSVWGAALFGEFLVRLLLSYTLAATVAYGLGSTILIVTIAVTFAWTFAYIRRVRRKIEAMREVTAQQIHP